MFNVLNFILPHIHNASRLVLEVPKPTMATISHSSVKPEPQEEHPVHNQQTTVYVAKDLATKLPSSEPQHGPEKIVIPISSLYREGQRRVRKPSHTIHEVDGEQETKGGFSFPLLYIVTAY